MSLFLIDLQGRPTSFVHIPKTGGTSIRRGREMSLYSLYDPPGIWPKPAFAVVRDPFDRAESCWRDFSFLRPQTDLDFVPFVKKYMSAEERDNRTNPSTIAHHLAPQTDPLHGLQHADTVLWFPNLQRDFDRFCRASLDLEPFHLPHFRNGEACPRAPRTEESEALIRSLFADDYEFIYERATSER